jgi:hypothetical protein
MEEGKEFMRSFGDLLQYHQKKKEQQKNSDQPQPAGANGATQPDKQGDMEASRQGE